MNILVVENNRTKGKEIIQVLHKMDLNLENLYQVHTGSKD